MARESVIAHAWLDRVVADQAEQQKILADFGPDVGDLTEADEVEGFYFDVKLKRYVLKEVS